MDTTTTETTPRTTKRLQAEYRKIRARSHCEDAVEFDLRVKDLMTEQGLAATPENFIRAAKTVRIPCRRCGGTGAFITGSLNGKLTGPGGSCFRCAGKGHQTDRDARRNYGADMHQRVY